MKQKFDWRLYQFPRLKKRLIELNKYDIELYEYAKQYALRNVKRCKIQSVKIIQHCTSKFDEGQY